VRKLFVADLLLVAVIWAAGDTALAQTGVYPATAYSSGPAVSGPVTTGSSRPWGVMNWIVPDDETVEDAAEDRAERTLRQIQDQTGERLSEDFKDGFEQAYVDLGTGGTGIVPAVPPKKYWSAYYRTAEGRMHAYEWFSGYEAGAELGRIDGMTEFRAIPSSFDYDYHCSECNRCRTCEQGHELAYPQVAPEPVPPEPTFPPPAPPATTFIPAGPPRLFKAQPVQPTPGFAALRQRPAPAFVPPAPAPPAEMDSPLVDFGRNGTVPVGAGHTDFGRE
jgi:hypothetical protein